MTLENPVSAYQCLFVGKYEKIAKISMYSTFQLVIYFM